MHTFIDKVNNSKPIKWIILISAFCSIIGFIYAIYFKDKLDIEYQILSNTNVIEINDSIKNINILYNDKKLSPDKELKLITLKIINTGDINISPSMYGTLSSNNNLGIGIKFNGELIEAPTFLYLSDKEYYKESLTIEEVNKNENSTTIYFSKIAIDKGEYFTIKFLILSNKKNNNNITPLGKISGLKKIPIINAIESKKEDQSPSIIILKIVSVIMSGITVLLAFFSFKPHITQNSKDKANDIPISLNAIITDKEVNDFFKIIKQHNTKKES